MQDFPDFPLGFGAASISGEGRGYGFGKISEQDAIRLVQKAFELGFRVFDTAPIYGFGLSEKRLAKALKEVRGDAFIVSKAGVTWDRNRRVDKCNAPDVVEKMLDQSLQDLAGDSIDLYMIHWPDPRNDIRSAMEVLARRKEKGDIRHIGLCNTFAEDFQRAEEVCSIEAIQDSWNAFSYFETAKRYEFLGERKIWKMGYATLDKGILTGRVDETRQFDDEDCRSWAPWWKNQNHYPKFELVKKLKSILFDYDLNLLDFALHFSRNKYDFIDLPLVGARNIEQLEGVVKSINKNVTKETLAEIEKRWREQGYSEAIVHA
tara:strand:- start:1957 stop:2913 length:957 start_codon:yes stop_codon:yes gene_type:complete